MNILVCGSRSIVDETWIFSQIDNWVSELGVEKSELCLINGAAKGVDSVAAKWAQANNVKTQVYKPDWAHYGRGAGIRRNEEMVTVSDNVLILWDGASKGTKNDIDLCFKKNKKYKVVKNNSI